MAHKLDVAQLRDELVDAFEWNEEDRARALMSQLAAQPGQARVVLDEMLASEDASVRRAAVFGLGELGELRQRQTPGAADGHRRGPGGP